jgi:hypothetical protein
VTGFWSSFWSEIFQSFAFGVSAVPSGIVLVTVLATSFESRVCVIAYRVVYVDPEHRDHGERFFNGPPGQWRPALAVFS